MKKSKRFKPVLRVAEAQEKKAVSALGDAQLVLQSHTARLEELQNYQQEYRQQLNTAGEKGMGAKRMLDFQNFLNNLKLAIEQQHSIISASTKVVEEKRQEWFKTRNKLKSYDNVMERYQADEQKLADKHEQLETDERAGRLHRSRQSD